LNLKKDDITGEWRKLYSEELNNLYSSHNIIRQMKWRMRWVGHVACMVEIQMGKILVGKHNANRLLGGPCHRWEDGIRMEIGGGGCRLDPVGSG
jgi:hypothetical protein